MIRILLPLGFALALVACTDTTPAMMATQTTITAAFSLDADLTTAAHFYDFPYPSDLRLNAKGGPDLSGFPNLRPAQIVEQLRPIAIDRHGFPVVPVSYVRFTGPIAPQTPTKTIPASKTSPILLIDVEPGARERLHLYPVVAETPTADDYIPDFLLEVAPRPGVVLRPGHKHALVVRRSLTDATGKPLAVEASLALLATGVTPPGARGAAAAALYAPLWKALDDLGIARSDVVAATVFTTGDVVQDTFDLSTAMLKNYSVKVTGLSQNLAEQKLEDKFCELQGTVSYPQFQTGTQPWNTQGTFQLGADGLPMKQGDLVAPVVITVPRSPMPTDGYPLIVYFHGSGGKSTQLADYGKDIGTGLTAVPQAGMGPGYYFAAKGIAGAASALPVNPERLPNASDTAYLNISNLSAFRDTFRQGIIEQRLFIEALRTIQIDPALLAGCSGPSLPKGVTAYRFNPDHLMLQGQSMGGMYTNLVGAVEPRVKAVVPTGAGGYWSYFIFSTHAINGAGILLANLLGTDASILDFLHPTMMLFETAVEATDPMVSMVRLARRPLMNHPVRPIYEPTGFGDSYFDFTVYDAMVLAYGNQEAGAAVWPSMQTALALEGDDGLQQYPLKQNRTSESGTMYTGVDVQYMADGPYDPHSIYRQLDAVKYQYGCFYESFLATGIATVPGPGLPTDACAK